MYNLYNTIYLPHLNYTYDYLPQQGRNGNTQNWKTGSAKFKPWSRKSTYPFGVFRGFLRNMRKYGL